jgi:hypothetical protein
MGANFLAKFHTFESEGAQAYLRRAGDLHKGNDFLRCICKPALYSAFLKEFCIMKMSEDQNWTESDLNVLDVYEWGFRILQGTLACSDETLKNVIQLLYRVLPGYELIKKGVRTGNMPAYNCGRRLLLPYAFALGKVNYCPAIVRDLIQYYVRMPVEIREAANRIFGLSDEGLNGKIEETNKLQKAHVLADTMKGIQAGAIMAGIAPSLAAAQSNFRAIPRKTT